MSSPDGTIWSGSCSNRSVSHHLGSDQQLLNTQGLSPVLRKFLLPLGLCLVGLFYVTSVLSAASEGTALQAPGCQPLKISFIDVRRGDSALIQAPDGFNLLIDGGNRNAGPTVVAYLKQQKVKEIDVMVATHTDNDHFEGLIDVLKSDITIGKVFTNGYPEITDSWNAFSTAVAGKGLNMRTMSYPKVFTWGFLKGQVLNPVLSSSYQPFSETNRQSIVLLLEYGRHRFFFSGDIDNTVEAEIISRKTPISADILKVAHHGSASSSSQEFLAAVDPLYAIISVGPNSYGLPEEETIERLKAAGATVLRTDEIGTIVITSNGSMYRVNSHIPMSCFFMPMISSHYFTPPTPTPTGTATLTPTRTPTPTRIPPTPVEDTPTPTLDEFLTLMKTPTLTSTSANPSR